MIPAESVILDCLATAAPRETADLVALLEAACGTCPRKGRAVLGAMIRDGALSRPYPGWVDRGPLFNQARRAAAETIR